MRSLFGKEHTAIKCIAHAIWIYIMYAQWCGIWKIWIISSFRNKPYLAHLAKPPAPHLTHANSKRLILGKQTREIVICSCEIGCIFFGATHRQVAGLRPPYKSVGTGRAEKERCCPYRGGGEDTFPVEMFALNNYIYTTLLLAVLNVSLWIIFFFFLCLMLFCLKVSYMLYPLILF